MKHSIKSIALTLLFAISLVAQAQKTPMRGRILETHSGEPVPFANIGVQGTFFGVATDENGYFSIDVPDDYLNKTLAVSAIGYRNKAFEVREVANQEFARITLDKEVYGFDAVDVTGQSLVAFRVVSDAIKLIAQNYYKSPLSIDFHYLDKTQVGESDARIREAIVTMTDQSAYSTPEVEDAYRNRNYNFVQVNKNFTPYSFYDAHTCYDELISLDVVRMGSSIFNSGLVSSFDLRVDAMMPYEGDSVWVISYKKDKPTVAHTGDFYASSIAGKLYILKSSKALVRHEVKIEAPKNNPTDRSLFTELKAQNSVSYQAVCIYQQFNGKYLMSYVSQDKHFTDAAGQPVVRSAKAAMIDLRDGGRMLPSRTYYEDTAYDKAYWDKFRQ